MSEITKKYKFTLENSQVFNSDDRRFLMLLPDLFDENVEKVKQHFYSNNTTDNGTIDDAISEKYNMIIQRIEGLTALSSNGIYFAYDVFTNTIKPIRFFEILYTFTNNEGITISLDKGDIKTLKKIL